METKEQQRGNGEILNNSLGQRQRRPANGFLGFCHVHRHIVSSRNKNCENRIVTKMLGGWWAILTDEEKYPFEARAREFKESFLAANPGFKWYTPRESTGNTPVTRQSNRRGRKLESSALSSSNIIIPGKLADVSQMGSLNNLMTKPVCDTSYIADEHNYLLKSPILNNNTIEAGETTTCKNGECNATDDNGLTLIKKFADIDEDSKVECTIKAYGGTGEETNVNKTFNEPMGVKRKLVEIPIETGAAKKRKSSTPRKNDNAALKNNEVIAIKKDLSFKEFMLACPVYDYDVFLQRKEECKKNAKKAMAKRRKRQAIVLKKGFSEGSTEKEESPRRRKKGRSVRAVAPKKQPQQQNVEEDNTFFVASEEQRGIDLLLTAIESLEH